MTLDYFAREHLPPCPECGQKLDWRVEQRNPYENERVPYCPACGFGTTAVAAHPAEEGE